MGIAVLPPASPLLPASLPPGAASVPAAFIAVDWKPQPAIIHNVTIHRLMRVTVHCRRALGGAERAADCGGPWS
jgi:hypothetical protein